MSEREECVNGNEWFGVDVIIAGGSSKVIQKGSASSPAMACSCQRYECYTWREGF